MPDSFAIPLTLTPAAQPLRPAVGWLLSSADPVRCLAEICAWQVDLTQTRLLILPHSRTDLRACAILAIPPQGSMPHVRHALPYGWQGTKLLLPVDASLRPALTNVELEALITSPLAVWHPALGLVECDDANGLRAWQLLSPPRLLQEDWNAAQHAEALPPSLNGIGLRMEALANDPFGGAGDEIGQASPTDLPPLEDEPSRSAAAQAGRKILGGLLQGGAHLAAGLEKLGSMIFSPFAGSGSGSGGGGGERPPKPGSIRAWLEKQSAAFFDRLDRARNAEIHRLMDWLNKDPEMALKFALPIGGTGDLGRGIAPPGVRLGLRNTNFQLGGLGGGDAADYWNLENQQRIALTNKYRELANRALAEGRHRRAAYIFAQLLGDIASAASALHQGRFFAEAAVLYRDRLQNKRMAAKCFIEGGLLLDAAKILEELNDWVEAGDLHARLEHSEDTRRCYDKAVLEALRQKDVLRAATLVEYKLLDPTQALQILHRAWPEHAQALACLTAEFDFHVRHRQVEAARERVRQLRETSHSAHLDPPLCTLLTALSRTYPDGEVRQRTRSYAVTTASRILARGTHGDARRVLNALTEIHPQDRLFKRDAHRFLTPPLAKPGVQPPPLPANKPKHLQTVSGTGGALIRGERKKLPGISRAFAATHGLGGLAVIGESVPNPAKPGSRSLQLACVSLSFPGQHFVTGWDLHPQLFEETTSYLDMAWIKPDQLWIRHALAEPFSVAILGITPDSGDLPLRAGTLHSIPLDTVAVDCGDGVWIKALRPNGTVTCQQADGTLLWTHNTPFHGAILRGRRGFAVRRERIIVALEDGLHVIDPPSAGETDERIAFGQNIVSFAANSPHARPLIAAGLERGIGLLPLDNLNPVHVNDTLDSPLVIFTARGTLLAFAEGAALAIQLRGSEPAQVHQFIWEERPAAITRGPERDQVILVYRDATYQVIEFREKA